MKQGRTLNELAAEITRQEQVKRDFLSTGDTMKMTENAGSFELRPVENPKVELSMSPIFHRQLGAALGIPAKYYDKMQAEKPDLLAKNVNDWLGERGDKKNMVRTMDGRARAFLSDRYRRIDNYQVALHALPIIGEMKGARVESCEVTETKMYIKVVNERLTAEVKKGDIVQAGVIISNSEVGMGSVSVMPLVYRLVCMNGMVVNDMGRRKYHIGRENDEQFELYSNETLIADDKAFMLKLQDIVRTAVDEAQFGKIIDRLKVAAEIQVTGKIADVVELTGGEFGMNGDERENVLKHLIMGNDLSLYGLANAVTRASQDTDDYERATAMEAAGWDIATMPIEVWTRINEGAIK